MATKKPAPYLTNRDLLAEIIACKKKGEMSDKLAKMLMLLTNRYALKPNFSGYTYIEDMKGYAILMLVRTWDSFDPKKSKNPFAFFTQCIKNSFIQFLNSEKRQRNIRDVMYIEEGLEPSYGYDRGEARPDEGPVSVSRRAEGSGSSMGSEDLYGEGSEADARAS